MPGTEVHGTVATSMRHSSEEGRDTALEFSELGASYGQDEDPISLTLDLRGIIPDGDGTDVHVGQAYIEIKQSAIQWKLGLTDTHFGYEPINPAGSPFVSRSWLYNTGPVNTMEASGTAGNETVQMTVSINTSNWLGNPPNNRLPSLFYGLSLSLGDVSILTNVGIGPESEDESLNAIFDVVATYDPSASVHFGLNYDYGTDEHNGESASWQGLDLYFVLRSSKIPLQWANRFEVFRDADGFISGEEDLFIMGLTSAITLKLGKTTPFLKDLEIRGEVNQQIGLNNATGDDTSFSGMLIYSGSTN